MSLYHKYVIIYMGDDMKPIHIVAEKKDIAPIVLLPGDPLRAKYIAENFLKDAKLVNSVRNMLAFTGTYKDVPVTVMGSGMGCPSIGIYSYELYHFYDVKKIIRIGSSGSLNPNVKISDVVLSTGAYSESALAYSWNKDTNKYQEATTQLNEIIANTALKMNIPLKYGPTYTSDIFDIYTDIEHLFERCPIRDDLMCAEMEAFALFFFAKECKKEAAMLTTVVDSKYTPEVVITPKERETSLNTMIELALESIIK